MKLSTILLVLVAAIACSVSSLAESNVAELRQLSVRKLEGDASDNGEDNGQDTTAAGDNGEDNGSDTGDNGSDNGSDNVITSMSAGAKAGASIGVLFGIGALAAAFVVCRKRRRNHTSGKEELEMSENTDVKDVDIA